MWNSSLPLCPIPWCSSDMTASQSPSTCDGMMVQAWLSVARQKNTRNTKNAKTTTRKQERNNQGNPSIPPHPQIQECHVQSCFVVFSSRTTSYLTIVQVLASATYPTLGPRQHLPLQSDSSSLSHTRLFPDKSETMHVIANSLKTSHIRQSCEEN